VDVVKSSVWKPAAGTQSIDLAGTASGNLQQQFKLPATGSYKLTFKYAGNPTCGASTKKMVVLSSGASGNVGGTFTFDTTGHTTTNMGWTPATLPLTGLAGQVVTLSFVDQSNSSCGMTLDAVSLKGA
jgi:hypothetical protein